MFSPAVTKVLEDLPASISGSLYWKHDVDSVLPECKVSLPRSAQHKLSPPLKPRIFIFVCVIDTAGYMQQLPIYAIRNEGPGKAVARNEATGWYWPQYEPRMRMLVPVRRFILVNEQRWGVYFKHLSLPHIIPGTRKTLPKICDAAGYSRDVVGVFVLLDCYAAFLLRTKAALPLTQLVLKISLFNLILQQFCNI